MPLLSAPPFLPSLWSFAASSSCVLGTTKQKLLWQKKERTSQRGHKSTLIASPDLPRRFDCGHHHQTRSHRIANPHGNQKCFVSMFPFTLPPPPAPLNAYQRIIHFPFFSEELRVRVRRERVRRVRQPQHSLQARGARRIHSQGWVKRAKRGEERRLENGQEMRPYEEALFSPSFKAS